MTQHIICNARIITTDDEFTGTLVVKDGLISAIDRSNTALPEAQDWAGDWLMPGLVELHTDNLEKHLSPRPGVLWNAHSAMTVHDAQCAAAGITTVLDSVVIGDLDEGGPRCQTQHTSIAALHQCREEGLLRVEHLLHLRCELSAPDMLEVFHQYADDSLLKLVSMMDHTPGQRQWRDLKSYRRYTERNGRYSDAEFDAMIAQRKADQQAYSPPHRIEIVRECQARSLPLASHDDTLLSDIAQAVEEGVGMSEFPTTVAAAQAARDANMAIIMGGPNMVKGGSHSGNVSAAELAQLDLLDIFSSDYVPSSLLMATFMLAPLQGWTLPKAVRTVTCNPARAIGLTDRGDVAVGQRADLLRVRMNRVGMPSVLETWVAGKRTF
ncbi:alpha-D-ribose 1-methylphosphonate 5-triphosphate diphosphatase [Rhodoferax antarcticus]|uniref:Phosphonate metabolism protein n=1 Tax=Rhodoferax antarcticus ANT.BR TaxID=1111071 RepID=A0A1Q8YJU8_9BURK|nr:alpha-D-ribose 1-methylphosphonate 5-triphosphate diphosphatase [Rhodoferax antarcticus]APW47698.1 phosphonate metabolism protein PhnM [Rhodoferax antarcticus]MCW2312517.1 alpha-D-ribose 1-methylphosphonate 5-triphosphate diphosphatase [Rhodoferax antarcticus]OLP08227.1 phosphonate metabolism protein [Rhodoferax antarcticus ANT.BR]